MMRTFKIPAVIKPNQLIEIARRTSHFNSVPFAGIAMGCVQYLGADGSHLTDGSISTVNRFQWLDEPGWEIQFETGERVQMYDLSDLWEIPGIGDLDRRDVREMVRKQIEEPSRRVPTLQELLRRRIALGE